MLYEYPYFDEPPHREDCPCSKCCGMRFDQRGESFYDELRLAGMREEDCLLEDDQIVRASTSRSERECQPRRQRNPQLELVAMVEIGAIDRPEVCFPVVTELPPPRRAEVRLPKRPHDWRRPHKGRPSRAMLRNAEE